MNWDFSAWHTDHETLNELPSRVNGEYFAWIPLFFQLQLHLRENDDQLLRTAWAATGVQAHTWVDTFSPVQQVLVALQFLVVAVFVVATCKTTAFFLSPLLGGLVLVCIATSTRCMQYRVVACTFVLLQATSCCFFKTPRPSRPLPTTTLSTQTYHHTPSGQDPLARSQLRQQLTAEHVMDLPIPQVM